MSLDTIKTERRVASEGESVVLDLSFPPSTNNLYANANSGRFPTKQYREWRDENGWRIAAARPAKVAGCVGLILHYEDRPGRRDLDNCLKAVLDLLVSHGIIDGDHRAIVRGIQAQWWQGISGVRVTIRPWSLCHPLFAAAKGSAA